MNDLWRVERLANGARLRVVGMDFGNLPQVIHATAAHEIWKVAGYMAWNGLGQARRFEPTTYYLVEKITPDTVRLVKQEMPGRRGKKLVTQWKSDLEQSEGRVKETHE